MPDYGHTLKTVGQNGQATPRISPMHEEYEEVEREEAPRTPGRCRDIGAPRTPGRCRDVDAHEDAEGDGDHALDQGKEVAAPLWPLARKCPRGDPLQDGNRDFTGNNKYQCSSAEVDRKIGRNTLGGAQ